MAYVPFFEKFSDIAEKETRVITTLKDYDLPLDSYALTEAYCDEPSCDCRRVFFNIIGTKNPNVLATVAFGWETKKFYAKWMGFSDPQTLNDLKGPALNLASPQSKLAPALLELVKKIVVTDEAYVDRLKTHYKLFREMVDNKTNEKKKKRVSAALDDADESSRPLSPKPRVKVKRNAPCYCGSGQKYKRCCMAKDWNRD